MNIEEFTDKFSCVAQEHPLLTVCRSTPKTKCSTDQQFTLNFYSIILNKHKSGVFQYGRTKYDGDNGSMYFMKPGQTIMGENLEWGMDGFNLSFKEDYLVGHPLHSEIKKYRYFDYEVNEALHLSPGEEQTMKELYTKIETEYFNNQDEFSREIILGHIASILRYSQRFYKRQFLHRTELSGKLISRFNEQLLAYYESGQLSEFGLPSVKYMANQLHLSSRYLSDVLKQETGKTAIDLIHTFLISEAKNLLKGTGLSVSEIAYSLGFENHPYFSRLFKRVSGVTPNEFKNQPLN
ncbi:helix-turn-helix domain-containing protein [Chitinophaga sp. 212800010-3]|jgi:AraC-like DNA-binding protein|uniref:helix-turn-helix domain-containing protein n=1 Tax=unclassified Chitinophaga TaxID=2619133 RepID=UPI002DE7BFDD|nr:response regulator transcription factor [Chitinophaga sp. 212800010-3]